MLTSIQIRSVLELDYKQWRQLWNSYNAFYGRANETALPETITASTWERFFNLAEPVFAIVATHDDKIIGFAHYLFHRSTIKIESFCYLLDLFTAPEYRGKGVGRALINEVYERARAAGTKRVYWQTKESNSAGRLLYDKVAKYHGFIVYSCDPV